MRVYLESTGCRLNQSEIETLGRQFERAGHTLAESAEEADLCVVNTCAVTREAERTSRVLIRRLSRANAGVPVVATGCYAHLSPDVVRALPGVERVVDNLDKERLVPLVLGSRWRASSGQGRWGARGRSSRRRTGATTVARSA